MKFKGKKKGFIRDDFGNFIEVLEGVELDLPEKYSNHPLLEVVGEPVPEKRKKKGRRNGRKTVPKGTDKNGDGVVTDKEMAAHLGSKGGKKAAANKKGKTVKKKSK